jgi:hypothetical protein
MEHYVVFHQLASESLDSYDWHRLYLLVSRFLTASKDVYPIYDLTPHEKLYMSFSLDKQILVSS